MASFAEGAVTLSPDDPVRVKEAGCWTLAFVVGESGLATGSAIHVTIPHGFTPPQVDNSDAPGFVTLEGVPEWSDVVAAVGIAPGGSDLGVFLYVERGPLKNGDRFQVIYGAGPGQAYVSAFAGAALFRVTVCAERDKETIFLPLQETPVLDVWASALQQLEVIAPSNGRAGEPLSIRVIGRDELGNRCRDWAGWFKVESEAEGVLIPASQRNQDVTGAGVELDVGLTDRLTGPLRLRVRESETDVVGVSNPILVGKQAPIWGDLHACLPESDGQTPELDFQLGVGDMPTLDRISFHFQAENPEEGTEGSAPSSGFLRFSLPDAGSDEMLPSHLLEIYSSWGNRECWGGRRTDVRAARDLEQTVHAVLAQGIIAGFAAGSNSRFGVGKDARRAEAGRGYAGGLTAVYVSSMDHQAVFAALRERRCYATTGARILLQMDINGHEMGRLVEVREGERDVLSERKISAQIYGTAPIERVEVLRNNVEVCTYQGDGEDVQFQWVDKQEMDRIALPRNLRGGGLTCYYYLRVTQENGEIAWSSPIWFMLKR